MGCILTKYNGNIIETINVIYQPLIVNGWYKCENINDVILDNNPTVENDGGDVIIGGRGGRHETGESKPGLYRVDPKNNGDNQAVEGLPDCQEKASL